MLTRGGASRDPQTGRRGRAPAPEAGAVGDPGRQGRPCVSDRQEVRGVILRRIIGRALALRRVSRPSDGRGFARRCQAEELLRQRGVASGEELAGEALHGDRVRPTPSSRRSAPARSSRLGRPPSCNASSRTTSRRSSRWRSRSRTSTSPSTQPAPSASPHSPASPPDGKGSSTAGSATRTSPSSHRRSRGTATSRHKGRYTVRRPWQPSRSTPTNCATRWPPRRSSKSVTAPACSFA